MIAKLWFRKQTVQLLISSNSIRKSNEILPRETTDANETMNPSLINREKSEANEEKVLLRKALTVNSDVVMDEPRWRCAYLSLEGGWKNHEY